VNRVGDTYFNQLERSGHAMRISDLDRFAGLGLRALRYPVIWERTAPDCPASADWSWADQGLGRLRQLGIRPIVGLVHHGSGPRWTSLVEPSFADGLAAFARAVAERFPWVTDYTPVNEPLTTARFSGLYGHWYPHGRDDRVFARALLTQCRAVAMAMHAIRSVNPNARLVQTDDIGKTHSTPELAYQAELENARRWLTWDLLCGQVDRDHPFWDRLMRDGIAESELAWFTEHPCPPDIIGVNYYLTSERFLDHRLERYAPEWHGGNGQDRYADVMAVRVLAGGQAGLRALIQEAWERYGLPIAVTEAHNGCTREEQLRWLADIWADAQDARAEGADVRAVTVWSLLGAFDWNTLVTRESGFYEPGVFDVRAPQPRPTALAGLVRDLAAGRPPEHVVLANPGWWRRPERFEHPPHHQRTIQQRAADAPVRRARSAPLLIAGGRGTLGRAFARVCDLRGLPYVLLDRAHLDIADRSSVEAGLDLFRPWAVVNAAGYTRVDDAETDVERCFRENSTGPALLAAACATRRVRLVSFSSDLVFDGQQQVPVPYVESARPAPLGVYGRSKSEGEVRVLAALDSALVVRTGPLFGPWAVHGFLGVALSTLAAGGTFRTADDALISPTYVPDMVHATLDLLVDGEAGIWHLANRGAITWLALAQAAATCAGIDATRLEGWPTKSLNAAAPRPLYRVLDSERGWFMPSLDHALGRYTSESLAHSRDLFSARHEQAAAALPALLRAYRNRGVA
jgi:dTDP-4-dehydrorhamnose reductase